MTRRTAPMLPAIAPVAGAIGVFGVAFGAAAEPLLGAPLTLGASLLMFSGAAQFAMIGLLGAGAAPAAVLGTVSVLGLRHVALGALLRHRLDELSVGRRAGLAWFLIDETAGLVLLGSSAPDRTLLHAGTACYAAWVTGTAVGLAGASLPGLEPMAAAVFPVLFIALAALTANSRSAVGRALAAGLLVVGLLAAWPGLGGLAPLLAAVAVAVPGDRP